MKFTTLPIALCGVFSCALASDVYSTFYDVNGNDLSSDNFDVSNTGCFSLSGATQITFSQGGVNSGTAGGPYCLTGWGGSGCSSGPTTQQFSDVDVTSSTYYQLNGGLANVASYSWSPKAC